MGEYQERPKRSSSNNNKNLPPIQAYEQYMYGGGFPEADRSPLPITPELIKQLEKEDEELFERFGSTPVYNKLKKKEIPRNRPRRVQPTEATQLSENKQNVRSKNEASISDKKDKDTAPISNEKKDIAGFSQAEKLLEVLNLTIQKLPSALGSQLKALINPASIAVMVGVLGAYTASHAVGVGFIADAAMGVSAGLFLGWQAVDVAKDLWGFAQYVNATTEADLDKAAEHLAKAVSTVGIDVILGILTKKAAGKLDKSEQITELGQPNLTRGDTPMSGELLENIKKKRFVHLVEPGSDEARYLERYKVNAVAGNYENDPNPFNLNAITLRSDAKKIEVLEEFLHGTQAKLGMTGSTNNTISLEVHVKDFMIRHKDILGLSDKDIEALTIMKKSYEQEL